MRLIVDGGALIAIDRRDRTVGAILRLAQQERVSIRTSGGVVAQVWRDGARQSNVARILTGVTIEPIDGDTSKQGVLLAKSKTSDLVDAHVALLAQSGDQVLTSDATDIRRPLRVRKVSAAIVRT